MRLLTSLVAVALGAACARSDGLCHGDAQCAAGEVCNSKGQCNVPKASGGSYYAHPADSSGIPGQPPTGSVTAAGGTVDKLFFAVTGDTRPHNPDEIASYPKDQVGEIAKSMNAVGAQFVIDVGDHMFVTTGKASDAKAQMDLYMQAISVFPRTFFMTMGNHECNAPFCSSAGGDANLDAFLAALKPISTLPYYSFDVHTRHGLAVFVVAADNAWDDTASNWLDATLTRADTEAAYTIVVRHHPVEGTRLGDTDVIGVVFRHKYSLILSGHSHQYEHAWDGPTKGRAVVVGLGGANPYLTGFGTILEEDNGDLTFRLYDSTGAPTADLAWSVPPRN